MPLGKQSLPSALSDIVAILLCPAANVTVIVPRSTIFFLGFALAVTAITLPRLIVSVTVNLNAMEHVAPAPPVQLTRMLAVGPLASGGACNGWGARSTARTGRRPRRTRGTWRRRLYHGRLLRLDGRAVPVCVRREL